MRLMTWLGGGVLVVEDRQAEAFSLDRTQTVFILFKVHGLGTCQEEPNSEAKSVQHLVDFSFVFLPGTTSIYIKIILT